MEARNSFYLLISFLILGANAIAGDFTQNPKVSAAAVTALQAQVTALQAQVTYLQTVIDVVEKDDKQVATWWQDYVKGLVPQVSQEGVSQEGVK